MVKQFLPLFPEEQCDLSSALAGGAPDERARRDLLRTEMEKEGFSVDPGEWWHFNYAGWEQYPILDIPFETIRKAGARRSDSVLLCGGVARAGRWTSPDFPGPKDFHMLRSSSNNRDPESKLRKMRRARWAAEEAIRKIRG